MNAILTQVINQLKIILLAFLDAKLLIKSSKFRLPKKSFSIDNIFNPFNLSYDIVDLKKDFINFSFEKLLSAEATVTGVTGIVNNIL